MTTTEQFDIAWKNIFSDDSLAFARKKLSADNLRQIMRHCASAFGNDVETPSGHRRLVAKRVPYSSIVGGGLTLLDADGRAGFIVNFMGTTAGITKEETTALSEQFAKFIETHGLFVPARSESKGDA